MHAALSGMRLILLPSPRAPCTCLTAAGVILGQNPFEILNQRLFDSAALSGDAPIWWRVVLWPPLFLALYNVLGRPVAALAHTAALLAFKRLVLGRLPPGRAREVSGPVDCKHCSVLFLAACSRPLARSHNSWLTREPCT